MRRSHFFHPDCEAMENRLAMSGAPTSHDLLAAALIEGMSMRKPKAPSFTATAISTIQVRLNWTKVAGASKYLIEEWSGGRWVQIGTMKNKTTAYVVSNLSPSTTYTFDVVYVTGGRKHWETATRVRTCDPPSPVCPWAIDHPVAVDSSSR